MNFILFRNVAEGDKFKYDGDLFVKTSANRAWELRNNKKYKEWGFLGNEKCVNVLK